MEGNCEKINPAQHFKYRNRSIVFALCMFTKTLIMQYKTLGCTGLNISVIGFGCMSLSKTGIAEAETLVTRAIEAGINYFDTADLYDRGENEKLIGALLKPVRKNIILATKAGNEWRADGSGWDWNPRKSYILKAVDDSLHRLQTDYIDLYQLHGGTIEDDIEDTIAAFEQLVQLGKIRYYGLSSIRPNVIRKYVELSDIQSVMMQYSLLDRRPEETMLDLLGENKISMLARGVLAQGLLVNKPAREYLGCTNAEVENVQMMLRALNEKGISSTRAALQYILQQPPVGSAVVGFRTGEQLADCLNALEEWVDTAILAGLSREIPVKMYEAHR